MNVIEFRTKAKDGMIKIPEKFKNLKSKNLKVKITIEEKVDNENTKLKLAKGKLKKYQNPRLRSKEKTAWINSVKR